MISVFYAGKLDTFVDSCYHTVDPALLASASAVEASAAPASLHSPVFGSLPSASTVLINQDVSTTSQIQLKATGVQSHIHKAPPKVKPRQVHLPLYKDTAKLYQILGLNEKDLSGMRTYRDYVDRM